MMIVRVTARVWLRVFVPITLALVLAACDSPEERIAKHLDRAADLLEEGAPEKAILEFRNVLKIDANHAPAHFAIGEITEARGDVQTAFSWFTKVVEIDPQHANANAKMARYHLIGGNVDQARGHLETALSVDPRNPEALALKASLETRERKFAEARRTLDAAWTLAPVSVDLDAVEISLALATGGLQAALQRTEEALKNHPTEVSLDLLKLQFLQQAGNSSGVGAHLQEVIQKYPDALRFRQALTQWAVQNDQPDIARDQLRALVAAQPNDTEAAINLIQFLYVQDGVNVAWAELQALIANSEAPTHLELLRAQFEVREGRTETAIADLTALIGRAGADANEVRAVLARLLLTEGEMAKADQIIEAALAEDENHIQIATLRIQRLLAENRPEDASQRLRAALDQAPNNVQLLVLSGQTQELLGNLGLASDQFAKAVQADGYEPKTVERYTQFLLRTGQMPAAEIILSESLRQHPEVVEIYGMLGFVRIQLEDWAGAEDIARRLGRLDPERANQMRAAILIGQERFDEGATLLRNLSEEDQSGPALIAALVQTYLQNNQAEEAEKYLEGLLSENPENVQALGIRGNLFLAEGDYAEAKARYRAILAIEAGNSGAHSALARLASAQGDSEGAERALRNGLEASPESINLRMRLAQLQEQRGDFTAAIETYELLYDRVPASALVANNLASLLSDYHADDPGALDRAYIIASRLRQMDQPHFRDTYGWTRYLKGEYQEALDYIAPLPEALPGNPWVSYHLGMIHAALDKPVEARLHLENALRESEGRSFPPAETIRATLEKLP